MCCLFHQKPENILLIDPENCKQIKIIDFGSARELRSGTIKPAVPGKGVVCGTLLYTAPEVLLGLDSDAKIDMWSVGVICYILLGMV